MNKKLTLSIEKSTIKDAKQYAKFKGKSLSELIESFLKVLHEDVGTGIKLSASVSALKGAVKLPGDFDYKKELVRSIGKKHRS